MSTAPLRILHVEDDPSDAFLVRRALQLSSLESAITLVSSHREFLDAIERESWDVVIADNALPTLTSEDVVLALRERHLPTPLVVLSGAGDEAQVVTSLEAGVADYILKDHLPQLIITLHRLRLAAQAADRTQ